MSAQQDVREYLQESFSVMLIDPAFEEGLTAHLEPNTLPEQAVKIQNILKAVVAG